MFQVDSPYPHSGTWHSNMAVGECVDVKGTDDTVSRRDPG